MDGAGGLFRGACAVYESQKLLCEVTSQAEAGDRESYVSSYAAGRQPSDIRMMTTECPQKTLSICTCPDSLETMLARRKGLLWTGCTCRHIQRGSWGVVQRGWQDSLATLGIAAQSEMTRSEINRLFE